MSYLKVNTVNNTSGVTLINSGSGNVVDTVTCWCSDQLILSSPTTGNGILIPGLSMCITPKKSTNVLICEWMVGGEIYNDVLFLVHKKVGSGNWTLITDAGYESYNTVQGNANYSGIAPGRFDPNFSSTSEMACITYHYVPNTTSQVCLGLALRGSVAYDNPINRTVASTGQTSYENTVSTGIMFEIGT